MGTGCALQHKVLCAHVPTGPDTGAQQPQNSLQLQEGQEGDQMWLRRKGSQVELSRVGRPCPAPMSAGKPVTAMASPAANPGPQAAAPTLLVQAVLRVTSEPM